MLINTEASLALYCSCCGKIKLHDISRFSLKNSVGRKLLCDCGQYMATINGIRHDQCLLDVACLTCETNHIVCVDLQDIWKGKVEKIYCSVSKLELGVSGNRQAIEEAVAKQELEFDSITREIDNDDYIEKPQVMIEVLNKISDIAETGGVCCSCGGHFIEADVKPDHVELICMQCDGRRLISAKTEADVLTVKSLVSIEISPGHLFSHQR
ncbi:MAG: hypothetical protein H6Q74_1603 [Firmicutes bacterium]|nr:hypothetical protein [Bacillota bacterium]